MHKIYITALIASLCASGAYASGKRFSVVNNPVSGNISIRKATPKAPASGLWRPSSQTDYVYEDGKWEKIGMVFFEYDSEGRVTTETIVYPKSSEYSEEVTFKKVYEYDEFGQVLEMTETIKNGDSWINNSRTVYVWDPVVHDFFTSRMGYDWSGSAWVANFRCETDDVTRNNEGNVTEVVKSLPLDNAMIPAYKLQWTYGEQGKATEYRFYENRSSGAPVWELEDGIMIKGIEWNRTDGQLVNDDTNELFSGSNRVSKADVYIDDELDGHFFAEYFEDRPEDYFVKQTFNDPTMVGATTSKTVTDKNGSFKIEEKMYVDDNGMIQSEPVETETYVLEIDNHDNIVGERISGSYEGESYMNGYRYENVYDAAGNLSESTAIAVSSEGGEELVEEYENKTVYGEYIDASSGVAEIVTDAAAFPARVYSVQGMLVKTVKSADELNALPQGLYILNGKKISVR